MSVRTAVLFVFIIFATGIQSAKILAWFPIPSISHQIVFRPIVHELVRRGHQVVLITPDPVYPLDKSLANLTQVNVHDISYANWKQLVIDHRVDKQKIIEQLKGFIGSFTKVFDEQARLPEVQKILKEKDSFDIVLTEACVRVAVALGHFIKKPLVLISSFGLVSAQYSAFGAPYQPFLFPTPGRQRLYNLTTTEKIGELISIATLEVILKTTEDHDLSVMRHHFGQDIMTLDDMTPLVKLVLANEHPLWADNHPVGPNIKYIGGVHQTPEKELPKDLKEYLDASKNGVIYISFGTNVRTALLPPEVVDAMIKVLSELPYNVLWKWDLEEIPGNHKNIKIAKWFPQADLLRHPNVKLFITQAGLQSTDEAITAAVPVIGMPVLGDQWYNAEKYVRHKIGLQLDLFTLKEEPFRNAIQTIISDPSYKSNMLRLRGIMRDAPIKPLDNAIWWIEHVLRHGGDHLTPPALGMTWVEYYEVKLLLILSLLFLIISIVFFTILKYVFNFVRNMFSVNVKVKKN